MEKILKGGTKVMYTVSKVCQINGSFMKGMKGK